MKLTLALILTTLSLTSIANTRITKPIQCDGEATIDGILFENRVSIELNLNGGQEPYGNRGHIAILDGTRYYHTGDLATCERKPGNMIMCRGLGIGNGPELVVWIDTKTLEGRGTYFNPKARRISTPNSSNTYSFKNLRCTI